MIICPCIACFVFGNGGGGGGWWQCIGMGRAALVLTITKIIKFVCKIIINEIGTML